MTEAEAHARFDAVIIGAGVIGGAIAYELAQRGLRTLSVDKAAMAGEGSTSASCAIVRFSYSTEAGVALSWEGMHYWTNWSDYIDADDEQGLIEFHQCGMLVLTFDGEKRCDKVREVWEQLEIPHENWDLDDLEARFPILDHGKYGPPKRPDDPEFWNDARSSITGALFAPDAGYVNDPQLSCHNLQRAAEAHGGEFWFNAEVSSIDRVDGRVGGVTLADGQRIAAPVVVNAAGPHSRIINEMAGVYEQMNIKTRALRHEVHHVPAPKDFDLLADGMVGADDDTGIYFRPEIGNNLLIGGVDADCDPEEVVDPDDYDTTLTEDDWQAHVLRANRRFPTLGVSHQRRGVVGLYDTSDDWLPIFDRTDLDGFYVAVGTSGNQFKNAGVVGHVMAELIVAVEGGHDHDSSPVVVTGRYTGCEIDLGFFSRNRSVNTDSSMSVHG